MKHIMELAEAYARHYMLEQQGHKHEADSAYSALRAALAAHTQAVGRASIAAYEEGRQGGMCHPAYTEHEREAWQSGIRRRQVSRIP